MARVEEQGADADRTSGNRWTEEELEALAEAIENGVTQLEMAAALPHRSWEAIRKKIAQVHGKGIKVPGTGFLAPSDTLLDYLEARPEAAVTMNVSASKNYLRQNARNEKRHRLRRLNLATLKSSSFALVAQLSDATSDNGRSC